MDRRQIGAAAEQAATTLLQAHDFIIVRRNFRRRLGELDIVARRGELLVIVEVRSRSSERFGGAAASIGWRKQRRLRRAAQQLLQDDPELARLRVRFDAILVTDPLAPLPRLEWIHHAFV